MLPAGRPVPTWPRPRPPSGTTSTTASASARATSNRQSTCAGRYRRRFRRISWCAHARVCTVRAGRLGRLEMTAEGVIALAARDLVKEYRQGPATERVLDGVSFDVIRGRFLSIMG